MSVQGVIFDCDGTLLDSMGAWLAAQEEIARQAGKDLSEEEVETICTLTIPETGAFMHERLGLGACAQEVVDMINRLMFEYYTTKTKARSGALDFVKGLFDRGICCSVASSTPSALLKIGLDGAGFSPYLHAVVSVDDVGASKREPAVYDRARTLMGTKKSNTWVFEDAVYALRTLQSAGYHCVGIYDNDVAGSIDELAIADILIHEFTELSCDEFITMAHTNKPLSKP